jgi:hypothetical protein
MVITGAERYSRYVGYGDTFAFDGDYCDTTPRCVSSAHRRAGLTAGGSDGSGRRRTTLVAIDALHFAKHEAFRQYEEEVRHVTCCARPPSADLERRTCFASSTRRTAASCRPPPAPRPLPPVRRTLAAPPPGHLCTYRWSTRQLGMRRVQRRRTAQVPAAVDGCDRRRPVCAHRAGIADAH